MDDFVVLRGAGVGLGAQLGGTAGQTDGGSLGLVLTFIETVGYDSGQCFSQITESSLVVMFVYGIAFIHSECSALSRGSRNTGLTSLPFCYTASFPVVIIRIAARYQTLLHYIACFLSSSFSN